MNTTLATVQFLGILFAGIGLSVVIDWKNISAAVREITRNPGTLWMWGFITLIFGAVLIVLNNAWTSGLPLVITIVGWAALIKGLYLLIFPNSAVSVYEKFNKAGVLIAGGTIALLLGLVFLYLGFM